MWFNPINRYRLDAVATYKKEAKCHQPNQPIWKVERQIRYKLPVTGEILSSGNGGLFHRRADIGAQILRLGRTLNGRDERYSKCVKHEKMQKKDLVHKWKFISFFTSIRCVGNSKHGGLGATGRSWGSLLQAAEGYFRTWSTRVAVMGLGY